MYCPQCSQQQISDEMRFCSRCGFSLSAVKELVFSGGHNAGTPSTEHDQTVSRGFRGAKQATWIMLITLAITLFIGILIAVDDDFAILMLAPSLALVFAFFRLLYAVFFEDRMRPREKKVLQSTVASAFPGRPIASVRQRELSASPGLPIDDFTSRGRRTAEVVQPPSVTEHTTKLLDDDRDA
jgi:hypothetical protein